MSDRNRPKRSEYMEWAKLHSAARFSLATSGIVSVPISEFPFDPTQLEITGTDPYGYRRLQERMALHTGAPIDCIVAAAGTSMANHLAMAAVLSAGDEVLIEAPAYGPLLDVANYLGVRVKRFQRRFENAFRVDVDELEAAVNERTRLIVLTNLHNPSGAVVDLETLRAIGNIALRAKTHVLVDEVYLEMLFVRDAPRSFSLGQTMAPVDENPFIVTSSLTKAYGLSGLRCGWILAAPEIAHRMWRFNDLFGANAAHPAERLSVVAFDNLQVFRDRACNLLERNRPLLDAFLDSRDDLECVRPVGGSTVFPRLRSGDSERFATLLRDKYETSVVPGRFFGMPQHFRIGISGHTEELRGGLERLSAALDEFSG